MNLPRSDLDPAIGVGVLATLGLGLWLTAAAILWACGVL